MQKSDEESLLAVRRFLCYDMPSDFMKGEVKEMKAAIHPAYQMTTVTCACGNTFETGSTAKNLKVDICSECHPFFTGKQKMINAGGRVDRFKKKYNLE
jgi:large subunit ribosomal protein L31